MLNVEKNSWNTLGILLGYSNTNTRAGQFSPLQLEKINVFVTNFLPLFPMRDTLALKQLFWWYLRTLYMNMNTTAFPSTKTVVYFADRALCGIRPLGQFFWLLAFDYFIFVCLLHFMKSFCKDFDILFSILLF